MSGQSTKEKKGALTPLSMSKNHAAGRLARGMGAPSEADH